MLKNLFIAISLCIMLVVASSCHKCDNCLHGGTCAGSGCSCPDPWSGANCDTSCTLGYEGYMCNTLSKSRFLGTWNCTSNDPLGNSQSFQIFFTDYPAQGAYVYLSNFNNKGYKITCTMSGKYSFDIDPQTSVGTLHAAVSGNGILRNGKLTLYVTEDGVSYFATATLQ